jgi:GTP-binding nuclear protein Ran
VFGALKIVLVGDGRVGKTTWVSKLLHTPSSKFIEDFPNPLFANNEVCDSSMEKYVPTLGVEVHPIHVNTNKGQMVFNIWDCAGQEKYGGLRDGYYIQGDGAIIMYDSTNQPWQESGIHVEKWANDVERVCHRNNNAFPMVEVATKCDNGVFPPQCIGISTKNSINLLIPLLELVRKINNDNSIVFL